MTKLSRLLRERSYLGRPVVRLKRYILNRRGDGVHSPYAFYLITKIIRNRHPYYCFGSLAFQTKFKSSTLTRKQKEFLFRLVQQERCRYACLISTSDSSLREYLDATGSLYSSSYSLSIDSDYVPDILVIENSRFVESNVVIELLKRMQQTYKRSFVIISRREKWGRRLVNELIDLPTSQLVIDLVDLILIVQDNRITHGRYKAFL